jgi:uncharacterized protein with HEPN domain
VVYAINRIQEQTAGRSFEEFARDQDSLDIAAWNFHVLGEASSHIPRDVIDAHPELPWTDIRAMRNRVIHGYFRLSPKILWDTATVELPVLLRPLQQLLSQEDGD